jgi:hypothetical protein
MKDGAFIARVLLVVSHIPDVPTAQCSELIRNGDMELSTTSYPHWLHDGTGVALFPGEGIGVSNAIVSSLY